VGSAYSARTLAEVAMFASVEARGAVLLPIYILSHFVQKVQKS
jgi:hypothetical protein